MRGPQRNLKLRVSACGCSLLGTVAGSPRGSTAFGSTHGFARILWLECWPMSQPAPSAHRAPDNLSLLAAVTHSSGGMHPLVGVGHHPPLPPQGHTAGPDRFASSASQALPNRSALHNSSEPPVASGSAALPDPTLASGTLSRTARKSSHLEDRSEDGFGEDGRPRKRSRQALSCGECKVGARANEPDQPDVRADGNSGRSHSAAAQNQGECIPCLNAVEIMPR